ncbi:hypothetical protein J7E26_11090 [Bacillus sp. ISL-51]|nr:hypothetical protein [Bacillus sp. ISL-51]
MAAKDNLIWNTNEKRGFELEYLFSAQYGGQPKPMSESWADYFCSNVLSDILTRRINLHLLKPHVSLICLMISNSLN